MTGQGQGQAKSERFTVSVELRAINSRFLKINFNGADAYGALISELESQIRDQIKRGTVNVHIRTDDHRGAGSYRLNEKVLRGYKQQLDATFDELPADALNFLLALPGVVEESDESDNGGEELAAVAKEALGSALATLNGMRGKEGESMATELLENCREIGKVADQIKTRAPVVVEAYADRLQDRINQMLAKMDAEIDRKDIVREIGIFSDRCDINEELVRLESHLEQFEQIIGGATSEGRKLDFLTQELLRETNTIGSKSNDAEIAGHVVQIKTMIERIREMVQNVE